MNVFVAIQPGAFDLTQEVVLLQGGDPGVGAVVTFVGLVRDINDGMPVSSLTLEHYPGMAEKEISAIVQEAGQRWALQSVRVIHRVGTLYPADPVVFVGVASQHRGDAFRACEFIMDYLKTRAPFWKREAGPAGERWLDQREVDLEKESRW